MKSCWTDPPTRLKVKRKTATPTAAKFNQEYTVSLVQRRKLNPPVDNPSRPIDALEQLIANYNDNDNDALEFDVPDNHDPNINNIAPVPLDQHPAARNDIIDYALNDDIKLNRDSDSNIESDDSESDSDNESENEEEQPIPLAQPIIAALPVIAVPIAVIAAVNAPPPIAIDTTLFKSNYPPFAYGLDNMTNVFPFESVLDVVAFFVSCIEDVCLCAFLYKFFDRNCSTCQMLVIESPIIALSSSTCEFNFRRSP
jgi:hypothetical protein